MNDCNGCTACCEGYLKADLITKVTERRIALGKETCPYLMKGVGCAIHDDGDQPAICERYACLWRRGTLPDIHKPSISGWLLTEDKGQAHLIKMRDDACEVSKKVLIDWALNVFKKVTLKTAKGGTIMIIRDLNE